MKSNKIIIFVLTAIFFAVTVCAFFAVFTVKEVKIEFSSAYKTDDAEVLTERLQKYVGVNLLFFKEAALKEDVEEFPYLELTEVKKSFPNVINVKVRERQEKYIFNYEDKTFIATADGFILSEKSVADDGRKLINLMFEGDIALEKAEIGQYISCNDNIALKTAFEFVDSVNADCIKNMTVSKNIEQTDVVFDTYTDVKIKIPKIYSRGIDKVVGAFNAYYKASDYKKIKNEIEAILRDDGIIGIIWKNN